MWPWFCLALFFWSSSAVAGPLPPLQCNGDDPDWRLELAGDVARLQFLGWTEMQVPHTAQAEGRDWPRALTLIGPRDSAIALVNRRICDDESYEIQLLTQRGQTPVLLTGCCRVDN